MATAMNMSRFLLMEPQPEEIFKKQVENNVRSDGRKLSQMRNLNITTGVIKNAQGSARVTQGKTVVVCGIKGELTHPTAADPDKGFIISNVELPALCSPIYKSGAPSEKAQTATKFLDNLLHSANIVNMEQLCIERDGLVWVLYADLICLNYDGNLLDVCVEALVEALKDVKLPTVKKNEETEAIETDLSTTHRLKLDVIPNSTSFAVYNELLLRDPTREEEVMTNGMMTLVVDQHANIVYTEKIGSENASEAATKRAEEISRLPRRCHDNGEDEEITMQTSDDHHGNHHDCHR